MLHFRSTAVVVGFTLSSNPTSVKLPFSDSLFADYQVVVFKGGGCGLFVYMTVPLSPAAADATPVAREDKHSY